jgi:lysyl-tRNA synthetase class 1
VHWADVAAQQLCKAHQKHVLATAITPSGPIHIGNMREILTTDAVHRSLKSAGCEGELIYIGDTFDPLRKVYPFLPSHYKEFVGKPLAEIPCLCGSHENYAQHYLTPFLKCLKTLGVQPRVYLAHEVYKGGKYQEAIKVVLEKKDEIKKIIEDITGRSLPSNWIPLNIHCSNCGGLGTETSDYNYPRVSYRCSCGQEESIDLRTSGACKLPWRIDWPARWKIFNVTFEAFGKDHAAAGGSWETGKVLSEKIFHYPPPMPLVYEFIHLKGKGAMHGSTGTAISAEDMLQMTSPEVLRFLLMKQNPTKHIEFDTGLGLLNLVDEYDEYEDVYFGKCTPKAGMKDAKRTYELSQPYHIPPGIPFHIPYRHLVTLTQIGHTWKGVKKILKRTEQLPSPLDTEEECNLVQRLKNVQYWLDNFAPEIVKFEIKKTLPTIKLTGDQKRFLSQVAQMLSKTEWKPDFIHSAIYTVIGDLENVGKKRLAKEGFKTIYQVLLGKENGPRAGYFLSSLEKDFVLDRFNKAAKA